MMSPVRILILTPTTLPAVTGNAMTVERWRRSLTAIGHHVNTLSALNITKQTLSQEIRRFQPHIIHAHHVLKAGSVLMDAYLAEMVRDIPFVVSPAGTDINGFKTPHEIPASFRKICRASEKILAQGPWMLERLRHLLPEMVDRFVYVPKAFMWLGDTPFDLKKACGFHSDAPVFFLPAGVRPVKGNLECLHWLKQVHGERPGIRAVFAGPTLDAAYANQFAAEIDRCSAFSCWIPLIPADAMQSAYAAADVVLNTSLSEGLSNTLMEAIAAGRPVLVSDIPGNRWPVLGNNGHKPCGLLFDRSNPEDFMEKAIQLIDDRALRQQFADACTLRTADFPTPEAEADGLDQVYRNILQGHHSLFC